MTRRLVAALGVFAFLLGASCSYFKNRTNDLLDVFWVDVDAGLLASAEVRVTDFFATGGGVAIQSEPIVNLHGRYVGRMTRGTGGIPGWWLINMYKDKHAVTMAPCIEASGEYSLALQPPPTNYVFFYPGEFFVGRQNFSYGIRKRGWRVADIAVGGSLFLGLRVGLSPGEFVDFLGGLIGLDPMSDDVFSRPRQTSREEDNSSPGTVLTPSR